jgi:peptide subunit release factor 1 (eRF1)
MSVSQKLRDLAALEPNGFPFVSLYLNTQANRHGRDEFERFVRKEFSDHAKTMARGSLERESFERDAGRITLFLRDKLKPSTNGLAIFACAAAGNYFEAIQMDAPIEKHALHVLELPHLYPLARLIDQYPRCVSLVADTTAARLTVVNLGKIESTMEIENVNTARTFAGEKSQPRFHRWIENHRMLFVKDVVELLDRVVRQENSNHVVLGGDEVIIPLLRDHMPDHLKDRIIDVLRLDIKAPEHEVFRATMGALRENNIQTDAEKVRDLLDKYREGGMAVVGLRDTLDALLQGQVDELILSSSLKEIRVDQRSLNRVPSISAAPKTLSENLAEPRSAAVVADMLVSRTLSTGAGLTFIEDRNLLAEVGGVGACLRYA